MLDAVIAFALAFVPAVAPAPELAEEIAEFAAALDAKDFASAGRATNPLDVRLMKISAALAAEPAPAPAEQKEARDEQAKILAAYERALRLSKAPADLHSKVLASAARGGPDGEKLVVKAIEWKHVAESEAALAAGLSALGRRPDVKRIALYEEHLKDPRVPVARSAIVAMGNYFGEKEPVRKKIVGILVRAYDGTSMEGQRQVGAEKNGPDAAGGRMAVRGDYQYQLARLTGGVHFLSSDLWLEWYRKNESEKWSDGVDRPDVKLDGLHGGPAPKRN